MQGRPEAAPHLQSSPPAPANPEQAFAPLPLRARGTLEILDVAIKVYKQYFWVLIGWSAVVSVASQVPYIAIFLWPLLVGSSVCCITAAVRGQAVKFNQCGQFTQPRYGAILGTAFFGVLIFFLLAIVGIVGVVLLGTLVFSTLQQLPVVIQVIGSVLLFLLLMLALSTALVWLNIALVVVCMEPGKAGSRAVGRAYELLKGYWIRVSTILTLLSIAMLLLGGILWAAGMAIFGIGSLPSLTSGQDLDAFWTFAIIGGVVSAAIGTLWNPIFYLTLGLFYLDLRVRKEALDIEWGAHVSAQSVAPDQSFNSTPNAVWAPESDLSLQKGQPSFQAALASVNQTPPPAPAPMTPEQQAWFGTQAAPPAEPAQLTLTKDEPRQVAAPPPVASSPIICSQCGQSSPAGQAFCMNCGARLQDSASASSPTDSSAPPQW